MLSAYVDAEHTDLLDLRTILRERASRYTGDASLCDQIVEMTICSILDEPELIERQAVKKSLLQAVDRTARQAIGVTDWRSGPLDIEVYPERDGYVVAFTDGERSDKMRFIRERFAIAHAKTLTKRTLVVRK